MSSARRQMTVRFYQTGDKPGGQPAYQYRLTAEPDAGAFRVVIVSLDPPGHPGALASPPQRVVAYDIDDALFESQAMVNSHHFGLKAVPGPVEDAPA